MTLKELLDSGLVYDNVKILNHHTDADLDYLFKATRIMGRAVKPTDFKFNTRLSDYNDNIEAYYDKEIECIAGARQAFTTLIILK